MPIGRVYLGGSVKKAIALINIMNMLKILFENKVVAYLALTAVMVVTFICAIAINTNTYSTLAWWVLLIMNLGVLIYLLKVEH